MSIKDGGPRELTFADVMGEQRDLMEEVNRLRKEKLRDKFAGRAMQGMIACGEEYDNAELGRFAYDVADAMLRAREAGQ